MMISSRYLLYVLSQLAANILAKKPNILIIVADDVGTGDVPGYWNSGIVNMPNLEDLVAQGTTLTDAHSTPLCAPSRYVLLSGNYQHRGKRYAGVWTMNYETNQFREGQQSIAEVLRDNGYDTAMFGKWHVGGKVKYLQNLSFFLSKTFNIDKILKRCSWTQPKFLQRRTTNQIISMLTKQIFYDL